MGKQQVPAPFPFERAKISRFAPRTAAAEPIATHPIPILSHPIVTGGGGATAGHLLTY